MNEGAKLEELEELEELELLPELEPAEQEYSPAPQPAPSKSKKSRRLPTLLRLSRRSTIFLSLTLTATIIFFVAGNQQDFLDSNLKLILQIISYNAIALSFFAALSSIECVFYLIKNKKIRLLIHLIAYLAILAFSVTISVFSLTVTLLSEGFSF
jgi:hypothetical protein